MLFKDGDFVVFVIFMLLLRISTLYVMIVLCILMYIKEGLKTEQKHVLLLRLLQEKLVFFFSDLCDGVGDNRGSYQ